MSSIFENVDRISTGAKLFVVAVGLLLMLAYSLNNQQPTQPYRTQASTLPGAPQRSLPHVAPTPALPTPVPFSGETPLFALQAPSGGPTVEVRRALPPDLKFPTPKYTPLPAVPSQSTPTPTLTPTPAATPTPTPDYNYAKWPDGRMLVHPEHFVRSHIVNVAPNDTLNLRSGPGTNFGPVTKIPPGGTSILEFDKDAVQDPDGETWWYPVEWQGFRGYVGGGYLAHGQ
jgi:Bacterial SH3 domain